MEKRGALASLGGYDEIEDQERELDLLRSLLAPKEGPSPEVQAPQPTEREVARGNALRNSWPVQMVKSLYEAAKLPGDVYAGRVDPMSDEALERSFDLAGVISGAGTLRSMRAGASPDVTLGTGGTKGGSFFSREGLSKVPDVPQVDLPRNNPPRGVPERVRDITTDKGVREKMLETVSDGVRMRGADWYNAEPLRERFVAELGKDKGNDAFRKYMDFVAATSPRSDVGSNVRNASYYYSRHMKGEGMPAVGDRNPQPYGHMAQRLHQMNAERVAGAGWDPLNNPKPASFVENLVGNQAPVTVDTHAFRLPAILGRDDRFLETAFQANKDAPKQNIQQMVRSGQISMDEAANRAAYWQAQPKANEYAAMEQYYKDLGRELGLSPAQTQAAAWVGDGKVTGLASDSSKPFLGFVEDRVMLTAQKTGLSPEEVLKRFIRGDMALYSAAPAGAAALAAGAAQEQSPPQSEPR